MTKNVNEKEVGVQDNSVRSESAGSNNDILPNKIRKGEKMNIEITLLNGQKMYITRDNYNFILHEGFKINTKASGKNNDRQSEKAMKHPKYFSTLENLLNGLLTFGLLKSDATSLDELKMDIKNIIEIINQIHAV